VPYISNTDADREHMLRAIGVSSIEDLFEGVPAALRASRKLEVPGPLSEIELVRHMRALTSMNRNGDEVTSFLGGGVYDSAVPAVVRHVTAMPQFSTAYTPYQAEVSQGTLQAIYEFQSLIVRLTGMEVANASMYDGATAAAEAALMAVAATKRQKVLVARTVNPSTREVLRTYVSATGIELVELRERGGVTDTDALAAHVADAAAVVIQHPNFFGLLEPMGAIGDTARSAGSLFVASVDPVSLALLAPPGHYGAEIAVGEAQCLGSPVGFGGPLLGFMATRRSHVRRLPGRIVGATVDSEGRRGFVMTLQTREQHIRREKATSNICTNQALVALAATVYLSLLGETGFKDLATAITSKAHYAADLLARIPGVRLPFGRRFFREFVIELPLAADKVKRELAEVGIWPGLRCACFYEGMERCLLVSVTERHTLHDIDSLSSALESIISARRRA
jgi:glycine dehydrogenase subunit 1